MTDTRSRALRASVTQKLAGDQGTREGQHQDQRDAVRETPIRPSGRWHGSPCRACPRPGSPARPGPPRARRTERAGRPQRGVQIGHDPLNARTPEHLEDGADLSRAARRMRRSHSAPVTPSAGRTCHGARTSTETATISTHTSAIFHPPEGGRSEFPVVGGEHPRPNAIRRYPSRRGLGVVDHHAAPRRPPGHGRNRDQVQVGSPRPPLRQLANVSATSARLRRSSRWRLIGHDHPGSMTRTAASASSCFWPPDSRWHG